MRLPLAKTLAQLGLAASGSEARRLIRARAA